MFIAKTHQNDVTPWMILNVTTNSDVDLSGITMCSAGAPLDHKYYDTTSRLIETQPHQPSGR